MGGGRGSGGPEPGALAGSRTRKADGVGQRVGGRADQGPSPGVCSGPLRVQVAPGSAPGWAELPRSGPGSPESSQSCGVSLAVAAAGAQDRLAAL